ncbi:hypothetical protein Tco_0528637 [Tanacetum coccineum]
MGTGCRNNIAGVQILSTVKMNQVLSENERLLAQAIDNDIVKTVMNLSNASGEPVNECQKCLELKTELLNKKDFVDKETYDKLCQDELRANLRAKDTVIVKFVEQINVLNGKDSCHQPPSSTPFVPPSRSDWDLLFQPICTECMYNWAHLPESVGSRCTISVTLINTRKLTTTLLFLTDVEEVNHDIEVAHMGKDPLLRGYSHGGGSPNWMRIKYGKLSFHHTIVARPLPKKLLNAGKKNLSVISKETVSSGVFGIRRILLALIAFAGLRIMLGFQRSIADCTLAAYTIWVDTCMTGRSKRQKIAGDIPRTIEKVGEWGIMPTEMELTLEQTQKVFSYEVLGKHAGVKNEKEIVVDLLWRRSDNENMSILPVKKLLQPQTWANDKAILLKNFKKDATLKLSKSTNQERYEHVGPEVASSQDGKVSMMAK